MKLKFLVLLVMIRLLSACGTQATETPTSAPQSTEPPATPTQTVANTSAPTDTAVPATEAPATQPVSQGVIVSFTNDILPIFNSRCANCHGGNRTEEGLVLLSYADVLKGSKNGAVVTPGIADESLLVELVSTQKMPKRGPKLTPTQIQLIVDWINQGALDN